MYLNKTKNDNCWRAQALQELELDGAQRNKSGVCNFVQIQSYNK
jgi:hypothetical protein